MAVEDLATVDETAAQPDFTVLPDLAPYEAPPGQVVAGDLVLRAITSDGWAIVSDDKGLVSAVELATGTSQLIASDQKARVAQVGATALVWHDLDNSGHGPLTLWSAAGGKQDVASKSEAMAFAGTPDGAEVAFLDGYDGTALTESIVECARDGNNLHTLVVDHDATVEPTFAFVGAWLVTWHRAAGAGSTAISSFDATGNGADLLFPAASGWFGDGAATVVVKSPANDASAIPAAGGAPTALASDVGSGLFLAGGDALWAGATSRALFRATPGSQPVQLQPSGAADLRALSPDGAWALYDSMVDANFRLFHDLNLSKTAAPAGNATPLVPDTSARLFGPGFTADSRYALWLGAIDQSTGLGTLSTWPIAGGGTQTVATSAHSWFTLDKARLLVRADIDATTALGTLEVIDLDGQIRSVVAGCGFALPTPDGKSAAYTLPLASGAPGLYLVSLP